AAQTYGDLFDCGVPCAVITRGSSFGFEVNYWSAFLSDTLTMNRLTVNLGLRFDEQYGTSRPSSSTANPTFPDILPAVNYPSSGRGFTWKDWQPRVGVTYALGPGRSTLFKASYARYAEVLPQIAVASTGSTFGAAYAYYAWND